ncbi:fimbrial protein [Paraburkholderia xenovorans]|uniref:fimbrial protein n=1 Tax=Paraburkholderia xenovorans TaxID=36873 RepID=UPI0038BB4CEE
MRSLWMSWEQALVWWGLVWVALLVSTAAHADDSGAQCTVTPSDTVVRFGNVNVNRDAAPGSIIATKTITATFTCNPAGYSSGNFQAAFSSWVSADSNSSQYIGSGTPGVGISVTANLPGQAPVLSSELLSAGLDGAVTLRGTLQAATTAKIKIDLVKTGPIKAGANVSISNFMAVAVYSKSPAGWIPQYIAINGATIAAPTCTVTPTSSVNLPSVSPSAFPSLGSTAGKTRFNIALSNCTSGSQLYMTLSDATNPANTGSNLSLSTDSTAKGVQLQMQRSDGTVVSYGPDSAVAGNVNQWLVGATVDRAMNIPMTVQYISTGTVTPGTVKGMATFTLSYQ